MTEPDATMSGKADSAWQVGAALAWLAAFSCFFYSLDLPNNRPLTRLDVWEASLSLPELVSPPEPGPQAPPQERVIWNNSGWRFFPQRFDLIGVALVILAGAWGVGSLLLRLIVVPDDRMERTVFAFGLGLAALSLLTLACGLAGWFSGPVLAIVLGASFITALVLRMPRGAVREEARRNDNPVWGKVAVAVGVAPFLLAMLLGSLLPSVDFDVNEYHFQGPKEFYQNGRITFLPHNVYTSFPFGTEMLTLLAMVLRGDWYRGALAGKCVLMVFGPLSGLALFACCRRYFGVRAALVAAFVYLTTPWVYRISTIAYVEGALCFYLFAALFAVMRAIEGAGTRGATNQDRAATREGEAPAEPPGQESVDASGSAGASPSREIADLKSGDRGYWMLAGLLAGMAMACKYTGVLAVVIPLFGVAAVWGGLEQWRRRETRLLTKKPGFWRGLRPAVWFACGTVVTIGPWLVKNLVETGNPVYPLAYSVFGGRDWDGALNAKWKAGHSAADFSLWNFANSIVDVAGRNDWHSALLFAFAPLACARRNGRQRTIRVWGYVGWLFLTWWLFTHRIDRFWVPVIPVVSLLAGVGAAWLIELGDLSPGEAGSPSTTSETESWLEPRLQQAGRWTALGVLAAGGVFNLTIVASAIGGYNQFLLDLNLAGQHAAHVTSPQIVYLNEHLPPGSKVLCVGEAQMFYARFPAVYNTVFDRSIFEEWMSSRPGDAAAALRPAAEIRKRLADEGITHVFVNWLEILRYRAPGSYGYTDFAAPERFDALQQAGLLDPAWQVPEAYMDLDEMLERDPNRQEQIESWGRGLVRNFGARRAFVTYQVFPVAR
jgi:hypothetical protein